MKEIKTMENVRVLIVNTAGEISFADITCLDDMNSIVDGLIDVVPCGDVDCFVNDEGLLIDLEPNPTAVDICRAFGGRVNCLVGNVFFTGGVDAEGNTLPITREAAAKAATVAIKSRIQRAVKS